MRRPNLINSELLLQNLIKRGEREVIRHIRSLNTYIDYLERHVEMKDIGVTLETGDDEYADLSEY